MNLREKIGQYIWETFVENPIPRCASYAFGYIAYHNDIPACLNMTYAVIGIESILGGLKVRKNRDDAEIKKILEELNET